MVNITIQSIVEKISGLHHGRTKEGMDTTERVWSKLDVITDKICVISLLKRNGCILRFYGIILICYMKAISLLDV